MKIICVGRNYAAHAAELQNEVPADPVLFMKPETALILPRQPFFIPDFSEEVHFEAELVVRINRLGKHIQAKFASKYYDEISVGIDFTARDLQSQLKQKGLPWEKAKAFDGSAAVGKFKKLDELPDRNNIEFSLVQNGEIKQEGQSSQMLFGINELIAYISRFFTLKIGDLIFTGTPAGVGKIAVNDRLDLFLFQEKLLSVNVK